MGGQGAQNSLSAVTALSPEEAWAAGVGFNSHSLVEQWNGKTWNVVPSSDAPDTKAANGSNGLLGIAARSRNDIWAVGVYSPQNITFLSG